MYTCIIHIITHIFYKILSHPTIETSLCTIIQSKVLKHLKYSGFFSLFSSNIFKVVNFFRGASLIIIQIEFPG